MSIPFQIDDNRGHEVSGLLYLEDEFIVFEVTVEKWGLLKQPMEQIKAEVAVVNNIRHETGLFKDKLFIIPKNSDLLGAIPGTHRGELKLKIAKRYREQVQEFVADVLFRKRKGA